MSVLRLLVAVTMVVGYLPVWRFRKNKFFYFFVFLSLIDPLYYVVHTILKLGTFNYYPYAFVITFLVIPLFKFKVRFLVSAPVLLLLPFLRGEALIEKWISALFIVFTILLLVFEIYDKAQEEKSIKFFIAALTINQIIHVFMIFLLYEDSGLFVELFNPFLILEISAYLFITIIGPNKQYNLKHIPESVENKKPVIAGNEVQENVLTQKLIKQYSLTRQEIKIVELLLQHLSNGEIAGELFIEKKTVQNHLNNIKTKLGFKNVAELRKNLKKIIK